MDEQLRSPETIKPFAEWPTMTPSLSVKGVAKVLTLFRGGLTSKSEVLPRLLFIAIYFFDFVWCPCSFSLSLSLRVSDMSLSLSLHTP